MPSGCRSPAGPFPRNRSVSVLPRTVPSVPHHSRVPHHCHSSGVNQGTHHIRGIAHALFVGGRRRQPSCGRAPCLRLPRFLITSIRRSHPGSRRIARHLITVSMWEPVIEASPVFSLSARCEHISDPIPPAQARLRIQPATRSQPSLLLPRVRAQDGFSCPPPASLSGEFLPSMILSVILAPLIDNIHTSPVELISDSSAFPVWLTVYRIVSGSDVRFYQ